MIHTIHTYIEKHQLLQPGDTVIAGVSGGADSIALLHVLVRLGYKCAAAHCNFHLRGEESDRDEAFVKQTADALNIPFLKADFDTTGYATRKHISIEMAARELRYQWFEELRVTYPAQAIAVAHHQDDSVETLLLNLTRGTGIRGLRGIQPRNEYLVRPLLAVNRNTVLEWLAQQHIAYQTDSSNWSDEYTRNFIRLRILPLLEEINPSVREAIARTAGHLADVETLYADLIEKERTRVMENVQQISIPKLMQSPAPRTILYEILKPYGYTRILAGSIFDALQGEAGKIFDAPKSSVRVIKDRDTLLLTTQHAKREATYTLEANDRLTTPITISTQKKRIDASFEIEKTPSVACFDYDKLSFPLTLRTWRKGDWFIPFGMWGRKKLSDYYSDHKFSRLRKEQTWLLCNGPDIIWVVGERPDARYRIGNAAKYALVVKIFI
jgi:tRNA(Ile)-lysidine synthase